MRKSTLVALLSLAILAAFAQSKTVEQIRADYNALKTEVARLPQMKETGIMYCLIVDDNPQGATYPGVGHFRSKTHFYYDVAGDEPPVLRLAVESYEGGTQRTETEAMYDERGRASFVFVSQRTVDGQPVVEQRLYMEGDSALDFTLNKIGVAEGLRAQSQRDVWMKANRLVKQFLSVMGGGDE